MDKSHRVSLENAYSLWMFGEWEELVDLKNYLDKNNKSYVHILCLAAGSEKRK
ncbi:hypothetical protein [Comamonas sp. lk]|uniref:hypothetical protein n=1 Tax=Comamonas sp. lk TaxID=2201272 RepID=UPI0013CF07A0|nr:hypothetical protein [Comamonas sp. lk]